MRAYPCGECGQIVTAAEFHSYDSCLLYKIGRGDDLAPADHAYLIALAVAALQRRVDAREIGAPV